MTVKIQNSALSISESLDSLKTTPLSMHRITFELVNAQQWYNIMKEARVLFGKNWRSQPNVKRKLDRDSWMKKHHRVWFDVPDPTFGTWCAVKLAIRVLEQNNK